jgi:hypothetical protein
MPYFILVRNKNKDQKGNFNGSLDCNPHHCSDCKPYNDPTNLCFDAIFRIKAAIDD